MIREIGGNEGFSIKIAFTRDLNVLEVESSDL